MAHGRPRSGPGALPTGALYLIATPIGNLEDLTLRALRILKEADLILCEDTRHSARLCAHFGIATRRESYHQHNEARRTPALVELIRAGTRVALVTDAGTPSISDPGQTLVAACRDAGIPVVPIPGANAAVLALAGSGLPSDVFLFAGFLDSRRSARRKRIQELVAMPATLVLYEAPHRILATLEDLAEILGPRDACLARELTKLHEEWLRGTLPEILETLRRRPRIEGELTLVIAPGAAPPMATETSSSIPEQVAREMSVASTSLKEAVRSVARQRGLARREVYRAVVEARRATGDPETEPNEDAPPPQPTQR